MGSIVVTIVVACVSPVFASGVPPALSLLTKHVFIPSGGLGVINNLIYTCFGWLLFLYLFSDFLEEGTSYSAAHELHRSNGRLGWIAHRVATVLVFVMAYAATVDVVLALMGGAVAAAADISFVALQILLDFLTLSCLLLAIFLISCSRNALAAHFMMAVVHLGSLYVFAASESASALVARILLIMPSVQGIYAIHGCPAPGSLAGIQVSMVGIGQSFLYLSVVAAALFALIAKHFLKRDFL